MSGGSDISIPGPSAAEQALQSEQTQLLRDQRDLLARSQREQQLLAPFLFDESGVDAQFNEEGEIIAFNKRPDSEADKIREDVELGFLQRTQAALKGELPINPALDRELEREEGLLNERLRKQLGPGFATSTPGIEALDKFTRSRSDIREGARRGDLSLSEQLSLSREGSNQARTNQTLASVLGVTNRSNINEGIGLAQGFGGAVNQFSNERQLQAQGSMANAQNRAQTMSALFGGLGQIAGTASGVGLAKFLG